MLLRFKRQGPAYAYEHLPTCVALASASRGTEGAVQEQSQRFSFTLQNTLKPLL